MREPSSRASALGRGSGDSHWGRHFRRGDAVPRSTSSERALSLTELWVPLAIGLAAIYGSLKVGIVPEEIVLFAAIVVVASMVASSAFGRSHNLFTKNLILLWGIFTAIYIAVTVTQPDLNVRYVVGDFALSMLPILVTLGYLAHPEWLSRRHGIGLLLALLAAASVVGSLFGQASSGRHDPPSAFLIAGAWYFALAPRSRAPVRLTAVATVVAVGYLAFSSGDRTHFILWVAAPLLVSLQANGPKSALRWSLVAFIAYLIAPMIGIQHADLVDSFKTTRFEAILSGRTDESLETRFSEAEDVRETIANEWPAAQWLVGYGHGASYQPGHSFIKANVGGSGRVHNIHFGPMLILFRYGFIGWVIYGSLIVLTLRLLRVARNQQLRGIDSALVGVSGIGFLLFTLEFLTLNATVQPAMGYSVGVLLAARALNSKPHAVEMPLTFGEAVVRRT